LTELSDFLRYDYEECAGDPCNEMMNQLQAFVDNKGNIGKEFKANNGKVYKVSKADNFEYTDPIDQSVAKNQVKVICVLKMMFNEN
jgi:phosphoglucomutase